MARTLLQKYGQRLATLVEQGKAEGEINPSISTHAACQVFIGAIQGLVIQSLIGNKSDAMKDKAPGVFAIVRRGIEIQS
jgi:hypothetical protein